MSISQTSAQDKPAIVPMMVYVLPFNFPTGRRFMIATANGREIRYDETDHIGEFDAWLEAFAVAQRLGARVKAPEDIKEAIIRYFARRGRQLHNDGYVRIHCANAYERQGWDTAAAELEAQIAETIGKPGLGYLPMAVSAKEIAAVMQ